MKLQTLLEYEEHNSYFTHDGSKYSINPVIRVASNKPVKNVKVSDLKWNMDHAVFANSRVKSANTNVPIIVTKTRNYGIVVLDGTHRLIKAVRMGNKTIPCRFVTEREIIPFKVN